MLRSLSIIILLTGCVTKEQHRTLTDSYEAWFLKTKGLYVDEVRDIPSVFASRQHEADAVAVVISSAREAAK